MIFKKMKNYLFDHTKTVRGMTYATAWLLCFTLVAGAFLNTTPSAYAKSANTSGFTDDQLEALDYLNEIRGKVGVLPVRLNAAISKAAEAHAAYYNLNKGLNVNYHSELAGTPGFTGGSAKERIEAAGYISESRFFGFGEVMSFQQTNSTDAIQSWLDTAYHRDIILSPSYDEIGIGLVDGTAVLDAVGSTSSPISGGISVYPYDGQTEVPVGFYGNEYPNPLDQFHADYSGYILSASTEGEMTSHQAVIKDENGTEVPYFEELYSDNTLFLFPKSVLKGYHTYTVTLKYQTNNTPGLQTKTWSFTTGKGQTTTRLLPDFGEITLNEGEQTQLNFQGKYSDGTSRTIDGGILYTITDPTGLQISSTGVLTALKAGDYTVTATVDNQSTRIAIKVYSKWKIKVYSGTAERPSDITGHPLQDSIEWGLRTGIIAPADDGLFHPDDSVSEAQFWTMLLRTYNVNIQAYNPVKLNHWADGAYFIAKARNYPLLGINNEANRNLPVTRQQVAEIVSAADGMNIDGSNAITYVLAKNYMLGVNELSLIGFQGSKKITRAEALQILQHLQQTLSELRGRPASPTPESSLPEMPTRQIYVKPAELVDRSIYAEFHADGTLVVEGKFSEFAGQSYMLKIQAAGTVPKQLEDIDVTFDSQGRFKAEAGPYKADVLNLDLYTPSMIYFTPVKYNTITDNQY
ncbi:CAP domain-containing protein [Paenibacillus sp. M1]|uniref:CAP domain-containing protein n=1 Tax=Paenibacillus haidiansis TaxID=1574488 RepID=A0ABU7VZC9_9BACL